ncbi:hypothetical protein CLIM01_04714 [Colletotrichum limetticola]|uniref:Dimethylaniline monooxygenase 2 n=1 Tax=Colletotrichum limetticola TaxID=1209924 RepID=A0ABQ9Q262_9PEZI|nr:hypothetical protein CLIM01_04714 [Colletotrichum limetticola]
MDVSRNKVAVIGLGAFGIVALKNLAEEGFEVTGFERNPYVGGLWKFTREDKTSVLPTTVVNISKERGCFTDFPFPDATTSQPSAEEVAQYLEDYVDHFKLRSMMRLNTFVTHVSHDDTLSKWIIEISDSPNEMFDRVIIATGMNQTPNYPNVKGIEQFKGETLHSKSYKSPEDFAGKKVLVFGLGNTGADTATSLVGHASEIYVSHREGALIVICHKLPRTNKGRPIDHTLNIRLITFQRLLERFFPNLSERLFNGFVKKLQDSAFNIRPEWNLSPAPSIKTSTPVVSDEIIPALESGKVESVPGVSCVTGPNEVELMGGRTLKVDAIIYCTGYKPNFSLLDHEADPTADTTPKWTAFQGSRGKPLPRLYQNVLSLKYPDSLAFMGCVAFATGAFVLYDLASMAVVQIWKGNSDLPPQQEMERTVDRHHDWLCDLAKNSNVHPQLVNGHSWSAWADKMAGTGVDEYLGWGWKGWRYWLKDRSFCNLLMGGIYSPHIYRYFDGKRSRWVRAREEIEKVNYTTSKNRLKTE